MDEQQPTTDDYDRFVMGVQKLFEETLTCHSHGGYYIEANNAMVTYKLEDSAGHVLLDGYVEASPEKGTIEWIPHLGDDDEYEYPMQDYARCLQDMETRLSAVEGATRRPDLCQ